MSRTLTLTGAIRYRAHKPWFGQPLLVLQVEEREQGEYLDNDTLYSSLIDRKIWRDATAEDITWLRVKNPAAMADNIKKGDSNG